MTLLTSLHSCIMADKYVYYLLLYNCVSPMFYEDNNRFVTAVFCTRNELWITFLLFDSYTSLVIARENTTLIIPYLQWYENFLKTTYY